MMRATTSGDAQRRSAAGSGRTAAMRRALASERGTALIIAVIMITIMGLFLFGFQMLNLGELNFGGYSRNSTLAFDLAEAGVREGVKRLALFGATPGTTCFVNSMATAVCGSSTSTPNPNTVAYQSPLASNSAIFPILSLGTINSASRATRVLVLARVKSGFGDVIIGPQVTFQGNASPIVGDTYADTSIQFQSYAKSPAPGSGATATTLTGPQVLAGTTICDFTGTPGNCPTTPYKYECANNSTAEVAPTGCTTQGGRAVDSGNNTLPVNWHPMTPLAMSGADFRAIINQCYPNLCAGTFNMTIVPAQTDGAVITNYSPVSYTPSYWSASGSGKVLLVVAQQAFCVTGSTVALPSGSPLSCGAGRFYGQTGATMRYLDWDLVQDDLTRGAARTFFQASSCTAPCANAGNENGVRYIPLIPVIQPLSLACNTNISPGINAFYNTSGDGKTCANPPTVAGSTTFSGTKSNPEFLVIDNGAPGGTPTQLFGSITSGNTSCSTQFDNYNWGVIMATGDVDLQAGFKFTGYIYTPGNVFSHGNVAIQGGIFSANNASSSAQVNQLDDLGTVNFCGGNNTDVVLNSQFYTFSDVTWQDRPAAAP